MDAIEVCVLGDCTFDVIAEPGGPLSPGGDAPARITIGAGGQGANVAVRLARLGRTVRLVAALADDAAGAWLRAHLVGEGVALHPHAAPRSSSVVALLDPDGDRTMLSDRAPLRITAAAIANAVGGAAWVHCSAYLLRDPREAAPILEALAPAVRSARLSLGGGSFETDADASAVRDAIDATRPDLLLLGLDEARRLVGTPTVEMEAAAAALAAWAPLAVVTAGAAGSAAATTGGSVLALPAEDGREPVVDATGAGDAFAAALIAGLLDEPRPPAGEGLRRVLAAASAAGSAAARVRGAQGRIPGERRAAAASA